MRTNKKRFATLMATCSIAGLTANAGAQEDPTATGGGKKPYVLVVIDSSASMEWTTEGDDRYPWYDRLDDGVADEVVPGQSIGEYRISSEVEMDIDITAPNEGPMAFGPCVMWEPIYADDGDVADACQDYTRPSWRPRTPDSWGLSQPYLSWHEFPVDGSGTLMGPRMWNFMRGDYDAVNELLITGGRLQDARQPRHVTIKEAMTGQMVLLPKNIDVSNGIDISSYNAKRFGPGCWLVPRQRDASAIPSDDSSYCLSPTRDEYANFWHYPDYNQPIPHFQEVYDGQLRDGVMDRLGSNVIFAFAAFDGYRDNANDVDTDGDGDVDLRKWDPNLLNDSILGNSPTSQQGWRTSSVDGVTPIGEGSKPCNGVDAPCYNMGLYRVVTPTSLSIPATFFPQISAYTQIALNDTGYLNEQGGSDFRLTPKERDSRDRAFLGTTFSKGFDKYIREFELGRQPIARATPLAAVMHDAYQFFGNGENGADPIGTDEFAECRPKHVVLLSDGSPEPERGETSLEGLAFGYDKNRYIYGTTEDEVRGMVSDVDNMLLPSGDLVAENDYGLRVHAVGLNIGEGDSAAIRKLAGIAIEGNSCAEALLGLNYIPDTIVGAGGKCDPDTQVCLVDQSAAVTAYMGTGSYMWARPGNTDKIECNIAPAFILNTNDPEAISTVLWRMFSELLASSGLSSRTRAVVANRLDQVDATDNFVVGGQYRLYSGVKIGGSDWWKGVINRLTLPCNGSSPPQKSLDEEVGTQVTLNNDPQDSRRIWTVVPHATIYDFVTERPQPLASTNSTYPMNFRLHEVDDTEDEFQGTYLTDLPGAASNILGTRVPFRREQLQKAYSPIATTDIYLNGLNASDGDEVSDIVNSFRGRVDARVEQSSGGTSADSRAIGGILNSNPVVVGPPELDLPIGSYREFRARYADRLTMLYVSSMDGLLHALHTGEADVAKRAMTVEGNLPGANDVDTVVTAGEQREAWAYMPFMLQRELSSNANSQAYLSDGTPVVKDVRLCNQDPTKNQNMQACRAICSGTDCNSYPSSYQWRTVLVQGRGLAGSGYFALDVTRPGGRDLTDVGGASIENPDPIALWEFDSTWERAQVEYLMGIEPDRVTGGVPPQSLWDTTECGNDVDNFWKGSFLGYSTSEAEIATLLVNDSANSTSKAQRPVAVFGGGVALADGVGCGAAASGLAIYVVDLQTGSLLRRFTSYFDDGNVEHHFGDSPVPGEGFYNDPGAGYFAGAPALFDAASGAIATRGFIGDSRGRMFRMDFLSSNPNDWKVELFFDPYSDADLRQAFTDSGFTSSETFGPAAYKPAIALTPGRDIMVVYGTGEPGDTVSNSQAQAIIALTENLTEREGVLAWAEVFEDGEKLTGEPVIFDRNVYFPTYALPPEDSCAPGTARIWGLQLVDQNLVSIEPSGSFAGNADISTNGLVSDPEATATRPPRWFGPVDPTLIRGITITLGPQCAVTDSGTDDPTIASRAPQRPQLIAQTAGNIDAALKNADDLSGTPPLNNIDRLVVDLPVPRTQSIPLSWSIVTN